VTFDLTPWAPPADPFLLVERTLTALGSRRGDGNEWQCPHHDDDVQSFGIERGDVWPVVMNCFAGCTYADLLNSLGMDADTFNGTKKFRYNYYGPDGTLSYFVKRTDQWVAGEAKGGEEGTVDHVRKEIQPSWYDKNGKAHTGLPKNVTRVLYNLPQVLAAAWEGKDVWLVEGEKCADIGTAYAAQHNAPLVFTTAHGGAQRLPLASMIDALANGNGARVTIMRDNDVSSIRWALRWHNALRERGLKVRIVKGIGVAKGADLYDHLEQGAKLKAVVSESVEVLREISQEAEDDAVEIAPVGRSELPEGLWPPPSMPQLVADEFLARFYLTSVSDHDGGPRRTCSTLVRWRGDWWHYTEVGYWRKLPDSHLSRDLSIALRGARCKGDDSQTVPWVQTPKRLNDVESMLTRAVLLEDDVEPDDWIIDGRDPTEAEERGRWVACLNGLLDLNTRELRPTTPEHFGQRILPYEYRSMTADDRAVILDPWMTFLNSLWREGAAEIDLLQEWIGYLASGETHLQKMMMLVGPPRAGKGVIEAVIAALLGKHQLTGITLTQLGSTFGIASLIGKSLGVIGDARFTGRVNEQSVAVERLLNITGENVVQAPRKYKDPWVGKLDARVMIVSNELPDLVDSSEALVGRFVILALKRSWLGREDVGLAERLTGDPRLLGAILDWALDGRDRLIREGKFTVPASGERERAELRASTNPVGAFAAVHLVREVGARVSKQEVYDRWRDVCASTGGTVGTIEGLGRKLRACGAVDGTVQRREAGTDQKLNCWRDVRLVKRRIST